MKISKVGILLLKIFSHFVDVSYLLFSALACLMPVSCCSVTGPLMCAVSAGASFLHQNSQARSVLSLISVLLHKGCQILLDATGALKFCSNFLPAFFQASPFPNCVVNAVVCWQESSMARCEFNFFLQVCESKLGFLKYLLL